MLNKLLLVLLLPAALFAGKIPITIEHADTLEKSNWGLMLRETLPKNQGMLFYFWPKQKANIWMFNCLMDLSVAFIDENKVIREIYELKAYPEMMDPSRPVKTLADLSKYQWHDPIYIFFRKKSVSSSFEASYALEMNKGWFQQHGVGPGSILHFEPNNPQGFIIPK